jgi:hypothetical protein
MNRPDNAAPQLPSLFAKEVQADVLIEEALPHKQAIVIAAIGLLLLLRQLVLQ